MYIRAKATDTEFAYTKAKELFKDIHILSDDSNEGEIAFVCEPMVYSNIQKNIEALNSSGIMVESAIRVGDL